MSKAIDNLRDIIAHLRSEGGCPWDREQTQASLLPSLLEETYEVIDAIDRNHVEDMKEELGDLLINIFMQAEIASEEHSFSIDSIASSACEKLIRRHPHVFANSVALTTSNAVLKQWEDIKRSERLTKIPEKSSSGSLLDGVPATFPSLIRAQKIQKKSSYANCFLNLRENIISSILLQINDLEKHINNVNLEIPDDCLENAIGDILFDLVHLSSSLSIEAESSLRKAIRKFENHFRCMEKSLPEGKDFKDLSPHEMNILWEKVKRSEPSTHGYPCNE